MLFVNYPKCSTCRKAKNWLDENAIEYESRHMQMKSRNGGKNQIYHSKDFSTLVV